MSIQGYGDETVRLNVTEVDAYMQLLYRVGSLAGLGLTYGGERDLYQQLGYKHVLGPQDFLNRFQRGDIARRIVDLYPTACWSDRAEVLELTVRGVERDNTPFVKEWTRLLHRTDPLTGEEIHVYETFKRLDVLMGLGRFAALVLGVPGNPEAPVRPGEFANQGIAALAYLQPYGENDLEVTQFDQDPRSPRFGKPLFYRVYPAGRAEPNYPSQGSTQPVGQSFKVHWSRVLHVAEGATSNPLYGEPRLMAIFNRLEDLDKVAGGGSEAFWKNADRGIHADVRDGYDGSLTVSPEPGNQTGVDLLKGQITNYVNRLSRFIVTQGVDVKHLGAQVADPGPYFNVLSNLIAATVKIPTRILFGSERGELASSQDQINWYEQVDARRKTWCAPVLLRPFINRLQMFGILPPTPNGYLTRWPQADALTQLDHAEITAKEAKQRFDNTQALEKLKAALPALLSADGKMNPAVIRFVGERVLALEGDDLQSFIAAAEALEVQPPAPTPTPPQDAQAAKPETNPLLNQEVTR